MSGTAADAEMDPVLRRDKFLAQMKGSSLKSMREAPLAADPRPQRPGARAARRAALPAEHRGRMRSVVAPDSVCSCRARRPAQEQLAAGTRFAVRGAEHQRKHVSVCHPARPLLAPLALQPPEHILHPVPVCPGAWPVRLAPDTSPPPACAPCPPSPQAQGRRGRACCDVAESDREAQNSASSPLLQRL